MFHMIAFVLRGGNFPASGHRAGDASVGALGVISEVGHVWAASSFVGGYSAFLLRLSAEDVRPFFLWYRASGFPVRCVQELMSGNSKGRVCALPLI